jgi:hypothetical protein
MELGSILEWRKSRELAQNAPPDAKTGGINSDNYVGILQTTG